MRQVTSTRGRPMAAGGNTSMPVTRPVARSQAGRHPISARPWAISSPPVRSVALPQRSMTSARGISPWACRWPRITSSAASPPELHGRRRRQHARIGGVEITPGGEHVAASARGRAGGAGSDPPAVERGDERDTLGIGARLPSRQQSRIGAVRCRHAAVDVEAVLDREVLEIAQPGVDAAQHRVGIGLAGDSGLARQTAAPRRLDDQSGQALASAAVEPIGLGIFIDQALEVPRIVGQARGDQWRRQMPDGHRRYPALGLGRLAGIADDEGIEHRQRPDHRLGKARRRQGDGLAGQPFQRAVRTHVHQRIGLRHMAQPQREGEERMAGRQRGVVIVGTPVARAAAIGRQRDGDVAEAAGAESERAIAQVGIVGRIAPGLAHADLHLRVKFGSQPRIVVKRQAGVVPIRVARITGRMG